VQPLPVDSPVVAEIRFMRGAIKGESKAARDKAIGISGVPRGSGARVRAGAW